MAGEQNCLVGLLLAQNNPTPMAQKVPSGPVPPHYGGFTITLGHTTLGRTPLDE
jgi:hypothetical protein